MEPTQKKNFVLLMIGFVFSLRSQQQEVKANQRNYEDQIKHLSSIQNTDALEVIRKFPEKFSISNYC